MPSTTPDPQPRAVVRGHTPVCRLCRSQGRGVRDRPSGSVAHHDVPAVQEPGVLSKVPVIPPWYFEAPDRHQRQPSSNAANRSAACRPMPEVDVRIPPLLRPLDRRFPTRRSPRGHRPSASAGSRPMRCCTTRALELPPGLVRRLWAGRRGPGQSSPRDVALVGGRTGGVRGPTRIPFRRCSVYAERWHADGRLTLRRWTDCVQTTGAKAWRPELGSAHVDVDGGPGRRRGREDRG